MRLTSGEKDLLRLLSHKSGTPLSRLELSPPGAEESARSVDVQINRLRQKIESDPANPVYLQTVRGAGYALYVDEEDDADERAFISASTVSLNAICRRGFTPDP